MYKKPKLAILTSTILFSFAQQAVAQFCADRSYVAWGGGATFEGDLTADQCIEIGSGGFGSANEYAGIAINMNMLAGSKLSVTGFFQDSIVNGADGNNARAEAWISKTYKIAWDDYDSRAPAIGSNISVDGGLIRVLDGGTLKDSFVNNNGLVYVSNSGTDKQGNPINDAGISINNTVNNGGKLYAYLGGKSYGTIIDNGGYEYVQQEGTSNGSIVNAGGRQMLTLEGIATGTIVKSDGLQQITRDALAQNTRIEAGGVQNIVNLGKADNTTVYGTQNIFTSTSEGTATNTKVYGNGTQIVKGESSKAIGVELFDNAIQNVSASAYVENLTINNTAKSWLGVNTKILGTTEVNHQGQLQLTAAESNTGAYAQKVNLNGANATIMVIANSNDTDSVKIDNLSGNGKIRFVNVTGVPLYSHLNIDQLSGSNHFYFNTSIGTGHSDYLTITEGRGNHKVSVADSGTEITQPTETSLDLITDHSNGAQFSLANIEGLNINAVDGGTYMYYLNSRDEAITGDTIWYLSTAANMTDNTDAPDNHINPEIPSIPNIVNPPSLTTPSTDAMLSMATAPVLIIKDGLDNLRFRKGELKTNSGNTGVWSRVIGSKSNIDSDHIQFKLVQTGFEGGVDKIIHTEHGHVLLGAFANYATADVKHKRGGTSNIENFGAGLYATYFDKSGLYVDGVLKYGRFKNKVSAISTNGIGIKGRYNQNGIGTSFEVGYNYMLPHNTWIEPYMQFSYINISGISTTLSSGMVAKIGNQRSMSTELGINLGKTFNLKKNNTVTMYVKAAWAHEYSNNNHTTINQFNRFNRFNTSLSGNMAKVGVGINAKLANNQLSLYSELNYAKGSKVDSPIKVNIGFRYSF